MRQLTLKISIEADRDLEDIWLYAARYNQAKARKLVKEIINKLNHLKQHPRMGRLRNELLPNLRSVVQGSHTIFYYATHEEVVIVRILHNRRDFTQHLN